MEKLFSLKVPVRGASGWVKGYELGGHVKARKRRDFRKWDELMMNLQEGSQGLRQSVHV